MSEIDGSVASSINQVCKSIYLSGSDLEHIGNIMLPGRYPRYLMPSLIHEMAHWECFSSPVGEALTHCYSRAWKYAELHTISIDKIGERSTDYEASLDYARYTLLTAILRPVSEGIALFAEFDSFPKESPVTLKVTRAAGLLFGNPEKLKSTSDALLGEIAYESLLIGRLEDEFVARKENLLCQKFETKSGGYLPGYIFVKNLQFYLVVSRGLTKLMDGDLYITCLRAVFYGDMGMASLLLDSSEDICFGSNAENDIGNKLFMRFHEQIEWIVHDIGEDYIDHIESTVGKQTSWDWLDLQITSRQESKVYVRKIESEINLISNSDIDSNVTKRLRTVDEVVRSNRNLLCLAHLPAYIVLNEHNRCLVCKRKPSSLKDIITAGASMVVDTVKEGIGEIQIFWQEEAGENAFIFVAYFEQNVVNCFSMNGDLNAKTESFLKQHPSLSNIKSVISYMDETLERVCSESPVSGIYADISETEVDKLYKEYCERFFSLYDNGSADRLALSGSLLELVEPEDLETIALYAKISLAAESFVSSASFENVCAHFEVDPVHTISQFRNLQISTGVPFITEIGDTGLFFRL